MISALYFSPIDSKNFTASSRSRLRARPALSFRAGHFCSIAQSSGEMAALANSIKAFSITGRSWTALREIAPYA